MCNKFSATLMIILVFGAISWANLWQQNQGFRAQLRQTLEENQLLHSNNQKLMEGNAEQGYQIDKLIGELAATKKALAQDKQTKEAEMAKVNAAWNLLRAEQIANHLIPHQGLEANKDPITYFEAAIFEMRHAQKLEGHHEPLAIPIISPPLFFLAKAHGYGFKLHEYADDALIVSLPKKKS